MKTWIKLHTEIIDDPKLGRLSFTDKGVWLCLLALAGKLDHRDNTGALTGQIGTLDDIAWLLRTQIADIQPSIERMIAAGMLHQDGDILYVTHFAQRQATDTDAERMQRYRQRKANTSNTPVTKQPAQRNTTVTQPLHDRYAPVTHPLRDRYHTESESDTESETEQNNNSSRTDNTRAKTRAHIAAAAAAISLPAAIANSPSPQAQSPAVSGAERGQGGEVTDALATGTAEITRATNALTELGIEPATTRHLIKTIPYHHIIGWTNYARNQPRLTNPAGYVIKMLRNGDPPPRSPNEPAHKTWFTPEEEALYFGTTPGILRNSCPTCSE